MKRAVFEKDFIRVEDSETGTPGAFLKFAFRVQAALYKLRYRFVHVKPQDKKYNVAVCAIFKNEAPYLKEWIEFNHLVGVEHFYLYNNNSEDDYQSVLEEYVQSGLVTLIQFPYEQAQMKCYKDCIDKYAGETKWLGFIDIDEFIVPKSTNDIYGFLKPFETKRGAVKLNWQLFGTSGRMDRYRRSCGGGFHCLLAEVLRRRQMLLQYGVRCQPGFAAECGDASQLLDDVQGKTASAGQCI